MILLNYAHPLSNAQRARATELLGSEPDVRDLGTTIDRALPLAEVAAALADAAGLDATAWQTTPLVLNPPALAPLALGLIAELHGRCGYFVPVLNVRPVAGAVPPQFEVAEVVNLQGMRETARMRRGGD